MMNSDAKKVDHNKQDS